MRKQVATLLTVIFLVAFSFTANAAIKPGTTCKKLGSTSLSSGKKYTCVKVGNKLVWNKGVIIKSPTPTPTQSPSPTETAEIKVGSQCLKLGEQLNRNNLLIECRPIEKNKLVFLSLASTFSQATNPLSPDPFTSCRVPDARTTKISGESISYPITETHIPSKGTLNVNFIPIDFPDSPGQGDPRAIINPQMEKLSDWFKWYSNGKLNINAETYGSWIRATDNSQYYAEGMGEGNPKASTEMSRFLDIAQKYINLNNSNVVFFIFPPELKTFATETTLSMGTKINGVEKVIGTYATGYRLYQNQRNILWFWLTHELIHAFGLAQHAPASPAFLNISTGNPGPGQSILEWDAMTLDWINTSDVWCSKLDTLSPTELTLVPMEREENGYRSAMINISSTQTLVIESHRKDKWGKEFKSGFYGVSVYLVDTRFNTDRSGEASGLDDFTGKKFTRAANYFYFPDLGHSNYIGDWIDQGVIQNNVELFSLNYLLYQGETVTVSGVKISVLKSDANDTLAISKAK